MPHEYDGLWAEREAAQAICALPPETVIRFRVRLTDEAMREMSQVRGTNPDLYVPRKPKKKGR